MGLGQDAPKLGMESPGPRRVLFVDFGHNAGFLLCDFDPKVYC